ncbi:hypothetical protein GNI_070310 [Gregarina niphandrodes]|uniref:Uncharacterized protein n=1 Tax=Gregarina niphandrodes TaxID=110365 RepID=A0A023B7H8_GRENI|nr:hypothetical protein GNI_070310 [Gregarina niphandrodes]EZG67245.1 hypothetical protein GNI_070310 [Gregarina niphandrodes]|eukprot:XP_011130290.1 hypothetical protein GNI_070310 [Gregarina niphandrodes]
MGSVPYGECGTTEVITDNSRVYTNLYSPIDGGQAVAVTCTCPLIEGGKCQPAASVLDSLSPVHQSSPRRLQGALVNSRATTGKSGSTLVSFSSNKQVFRFDLKNAEDGIIPWPATCDVRTNNGTGQRRIIDNGCPLDQGLLFEYHAAETPGTTIFSTAPFGSKYERSSLSITCALTEVPETKVTEMLATCPGYTAPRRSLAEASNSKTVKMKTGEPFSGMLSADSTHLKFGKTLRETAKDKEEVEVRSRVKVLEKAVSSGAFGNFEEAIRRAEEFDESVRKPEQIGGGTNRLPLDQVYNQYIHGPVAVNWGAQGSTRAWDAGVVAPILYMNGGLSPSNRGGYYSVGVHGDLLNTQWVEATQTVNVGFAKKLYGVNVDVSTGAPGAAYEVRARNVDVISAADSIDRAFGQRVAVRNFGLSYRRDLNDIIDPADSDFGTEIYVQYRTINVALGTDVLDTRYYISIGMLGVNVAATRDFDSYATNLQINWGRGWQIFLEGDFPDDGNLRLGQAVGIGKPNRMYLAVGSGVGETGLPLAAVNWQGPHAHIGLGWLEKGGERVTQYAVTVGRHTYLWENTFLPDLIRIPQI